MCSNTGFPMKYDYDRGRWPQRPPGVRWSQMVLGPRATQRVIRDKGEVVVSAYDTRDGRRFYVAAPAEGRPGPGVKYRIRVRMKK